MKTNVRVAVILLTVLGCVGCDQVTKSIARDHLPLRQVISLFNDTVRFQHTENPGAFLSLGDTLSSTARRVLFTLGGAWLVAATAIWAFRSKRISVSQIVGAALICGGGLGNVIDRVSHGGNVTDFLNVGVGHVRTGIFNFADMVLMLGLALLVAGDIYGARLSRNPLAPRTRRKAWHERSGSDLWPVANSREVTGELGDLSFQLTQRQRRLLAHTGFVHDCLSMAVYPYSTLLEWQTPREQKPTSRLLTAGAA
jgi:signal peptidase II